ncbi:MAG: YeeE/YedE family protein [Salinarimonadaceae bacterium]|nr:MAG: YeeE/YedE family protein [Salinarimonadaceae bacterium]
MTRATTSHDQAAAPRPQHVVTALALVAIAGGGAYILARTGWRPAALWLVGTGLGFALYHGAFGFTGAYRALITRGESASVRAQMVMLAVAVAIFFPLLEAGSAFGAPVRGFVFPAGIEMALGAFIFGIGMQIGGGCASGTLYTSGGGDTRTFITLVFFVVGMTLGAWDVERWQGLPSLPPVSLPESLGMWPALALSMGVFALVAWLAARREQRLTGSVAPIFVRTDARFFQGPWAFAWAALALALLNAATLVIAGRPWAITQSFAIWGSLVVDRFGIDDPFFWAYWEEPTRVDLLHRPLIQDTMTLMNVGLTLGAFLAAGLAARFRPGLRIGFRPLLAAIIGGLMLGYGARMATGCNISAFFSGVASGSIHGWVWIAAAIPGTWVGVRLRPLFGLADTAPPR